MGTSRAAGPGEHSKGRDRCWQVIVHGPLLAAIDTTDA